MNVAVSIRRPFSVVPCLLVALGLARGGVRAGSADDPFWTAHVVPVLTEHCADCHNARKSKSGLDLGTPETVLRGGDRGPAVVPGQPAESLLLTVLDPEADPHMPPKGQVSEEARQALAAWVTRLGGSPATVSEASVPEAGAAPDRDAWVPPAGTGPSEAVDGFLARAWRREGIRPARDAGDAAFARRAYLDLIGRIPTVSELSGFLAEPRRDRRGRLVDRLLGGAEHPRHFREVFDVVLMGRGGARVTEERAAHGWDGYLESVFRENRPWDAVVRELVVARPRPEDRGVVQFLWERRDNPQAIAEALAPVVFGVQIQCAQCHDHMVAREIKQAHYWGMVAAFNRSRNVDTEAGIGVAESAIGGFVSFANLRKESQPARLVFFNGRSVDETWPAEGEKEVDSPERYRVPPPPEKQRPAQPAVPRFSRREALAAAVTEDNPLLARAMVNRVWAMLFGRGLVHPVELMDSKHPPSHPALLDWLSADFAASGYDVRRLVRALVLSRAYALDSRPADGGWRNRWRRLLGREATPSVAPPDAFARAVPRPLSAEQLVRSLLVAMGRGPDAGGRFDAGVESELLRAFVREFPDLFAADYNATLQQAMFLSNAPVLDGILKPQGGNLTERVLGIADPADRVDTLFEAVLGRRPEPAERAEALAYLGGRADPDGVKQLTWALVTGAEFQLNH